MCEPTTILAGSALALGAVSAYGQYQTGQQQARMANANADAQEIAARDTINAGNDAAYQQRQQTRQLQGQQAAAFGAGGTDMTSGSALNIFGDTAAGGQLDALTTVNNAERQAAGLNFQAGVSRAQGQIDRNAANLGVATTILNSSLTAYGAYKSSGALDKPATKAGSGSSNNMFSNARSSRYGSNAFTF